MLLSEAYAQHDGHELRIDVRGRRIVIARLGIDTVRCVADPEGKAAARVSAENAGGGTGQGLAGGHESAGAIESPPEPRRRTSRGPTDDCD